MDDLLFVAQAPITQQDVTQALERGRVWIMWCGERLQIIGAGTDQALAKHPDGAVELVPLTQIADLIEEAPHGEGC